MFRLIILLSVASYAICADPPTGGSLDDLINNVFTKGPDNGDNGNTQPINNGGNGNGNFQPINNGGNGNTRPINNGGNGNGNGNVQPIDNGGNGGNFPDNGGSNVILF